MLTWSQTYLSIIELVVSCLFVLGAYIKTNEREITSTFVFGFLKMIEATATKHKCKRMGSIPILCINVNIIIDTLLQFDANVNNDVQCERTLTRLRHKPTA